MPGLAAISSQVMPPTYVFSGVYIAHPVIMPNDYQFLEQEVNET